MIHTTPTPHAESSDAVLHALQGSLHGLAQAEAAARLETYGPNQLPQPQPAGLWQVFFRQFTSPLIYVLLAAAAAGRAHGKVYAAGGDYSWRGRIDHGGGGTVAGHGLQRGFSAGRGTRGVGDSRRLAGGADCGAGDGHASHGEASRHYPPAGSSGGPGFLHVYCNR